MKKRSVLSRFAAAALCLTLLFAQAAQALTPEQALSLLETHYVDDLPAAVYEQTTVEGMVSALGDPFTTYFSPEEYSAFLGTMSDTRLVGIGVVYTPQEDGLHLSDILPGSPAEAGGLKAGDVIVTVDGHSTKGVAAQEAASWIQGEEGSKVRITYLRGRNRTTVSLTRATVVVPATTSELVDGHIGYIQCSTFGDETVGHFQDAIEAYGDQATCWIIDLRDNVGGITYAATEAAGLFTGPGKIAYFRDGSGAYNIFRHEEKAATILPVIVLINENSASSTEIFAAAIQGSESGIVIGSRSFGKGVAQTLLDNKTLPELFPEGDAMKITSYRFFSTLGNTTDQVGVIPNIMASPKDAPDLAWLLAGSAEGSRVERPLRIDLGYGHPWRWHVDLDVALAEENRPLFALLLNSLPAGTALWEREDKDSDWTPTSAEAVCGAHGLPYEAASFSDLADSAFPDALNGLRYYGLIRGGGDGAYHPKNALNRAELCQLLAEALSCTASSTATPFSDVPADAWYAPAVSAVSGMGLVNGVGDGTFHPDEIVDHQQFLTIMGRLSQRLSMLFYGKADKIPPGALETETMAGYAEWARPWVWVLTESQSNLFGMTLSMAWDDLSNISAGAPTTRDEAAATLFGLLTYTGILPA